MDRRKTLSHRPKQFRDPALIRADLSRLISDRGLVRFGIFHVSGDGQLLPDGSENASGYVIDDQEEIFWFRLDWDGKRRCLALTEWERVANAEAEWPEHDPEYRRARDKAGLPPPESHSAAGV
jgi:hypothetical protein